MSLTKEQQKYYEKGRYAANKSLKEEKARVGRVADAQQAEWKRIDAAQDSKFHIGADQYAGLTKVVEESGEACQAIAKLMASQGWPHHWDGTNLIDCIRDEMADLAAAIDFVMLINPEFDWHPFIRRREEKKALFLEWHKEQPPLPTGEKQ